MTNQLPDRNLTEEFIAAERAVIDAVSLFCLTRRVDDLQPIIAANQQRTGLRDQILRANILTK